MKLFIIASFSDFPMYFWSLLRAFNCIAAVEHSIKICSLNFNWSLIFIPSNFIEFVVLISLLSLINFCAAYVSFLFRIIAWNLSEFTTISFSLNHPTESSPSASKIFIRSANWSQTAVIVLSSAKLCKSVFFKHKNKSLRNILNNIGPSIEPCGTPDRIFKKSLQMLLILTHCLRFLK